MTAGGRHAAGRGRRGDAIGELGDLAQQGAELSGVDGADHHRGLRHDGGVAAHVVEHRELTHVVTGAEGGDDRAVAHHLHLAFEHDHELVTPVPFLDDRLARLHPAVEHGARHVFELAVGEAGEQGHGPQLGVEGELVHGRASYGSPAPVAARA